MRTLVIAAAAAALALPLSPRAGLAQQADPHAAPREGQARVQASRETQAFILQAAMSDRFEMLSSEMAIERGRDPSVRRFAEEMMRDHGLSTERLVALAASRGVEPPRELDDRRRAKLEALEEAEDDAFDALYAQQQADAHLEAVQLFQSYVQRGDDRDVLAFAQETLPLLQNHYSGARALQRQAAQPPETAGGAASEPGVLPPGIDGRRPPLR